MHMQAVQLYLFNAYDYAEVILLFKSILFSHNS